MWIRRNRSWLPVRRSGWAWGSLTGIGVAALALATSSNASDWPSWRGPLQTGVSLDTGTPSSTKEIKWRVPFGGRSTPVILNGRVFGIDLAGEGVMQQDRVFALDFETGKLLWEHRFNVFHTDVPDSRVGWSSLAADPETGYVYAHGVEGMFFCFDRDGHILWSRSLTELYGRISGYGGRTHTPVIDEDRVIISFLNSSFGSQAPPLHRYLALDKRTGEILWWSAPGGKPEDTTYSVPVVATINGQRLLIAGNGDGGIYAMQARTGQKVWGFKFSQRAINASVVVDGYRVYATHGEENLDSTAMGRVVCIDARGSGDVTKTHELWRCDGVEAGYSSPLLHDGRLYVISNSGVLHCFDANNGAELWRHMVGRVGKGSPVWADGHIYVTMANGTFSIVRDLGKEARVVDKMTFRGPGNATLELFGSPAVANGRVVFFTANEMLCLGSNAAAKGDSAILADRKVTTVSYIAAAKGDSPIFAETKIGTVPALLLVRPGEVLLAPGQAQEFHALVYDRQGQLLKTVAAHWSYRGPGGAVDGTGRFQAAAGPKGSIGELTAQFEGLSGAGRVRIVPQLPIASNFQALAGDQLPSWWIGTSKLKYALETVDGVKVLKKLADDRGPIFNRSLVFVTAPLKTGYTVQADLMGVAEGHRRGDLGLVNARYNLELLGSTQRLRVVSWVPGPRFEKQIEFPWEAGRWYTAILRVELEDGRAHLHGKVWPRGQVEPDAWTIEGVDPQPNQEGAAGIYANSLAPLYFDNVKISQGVARP